MERTMKVSKEMKRVVIVAKGEVQRVGYRDEVERIARKLRLSGFVENIKPYDVRIVAEGEADIISRFIEQIKIKKYPIDVEDIEVNFEDFKGEFEYFEIRRGDWHEELGERLDAAGKLLYKSVELGEKSVQLGEKSVQLGEKSVQLGEKSVQLGEKSVKLTEESVRIEHTMLEKQDSMLAKQDETIDEIRGLRYDLKAYMEQRFDKIEQEIVAIKEKIGLSVQNL
jgi:acylphosphatase